MIPYPDAKECAQALIGLAGNILISRQPCQNLRLILISTPLSIPLFGSERHTVHICHLSIGRRLVVACPSKRRGWSFSYPSEQPIMNLFDS
jgi:hypothetical protein